MSNEEKIIQLATLRHQFERQMVRVRSRRENGCLCANKPGSGKRDYYRTDRSCDLCGPFVAAYNRARTELDRVLTVSLASVGFDPEAKADEHVDNHLAECRALGIDKELFINV